MTPRDDTPARAERQEKTTGSLEVGKKAIQALWGLSALQHGAVMSAALWGTVAGSLAGGWPTDRLGRKQTLIWIGVLYVVPALWSGLAAGALSLTTARFIGGVGIATVASPLYISEIAPPLYRGRLAGLFQFNIVLGLLVAFVSNAQIGGTGPNDWRWMPGVVVHELGLARAAVTSRTTL